MKKQQQRQILEMLETLNEAQTAGLYAGCQDAAISISNFIINIEGEGTQTVALLEEYCELLFNASNGEIGKKGLRKHLIKVENSIKNELRPNRIEIAFMPYKRAMSDSLESIWQVALQDPQCDAYIIPLPYYDRLPSGAFGRMHYEGNLYPSDLPVADWRKYDVEKRHPDIIFIHYPYDDENYVTSLPPDFYSKRLKNFTDLLVYVPYFVCTDDVQEHFCTASGCVFADKVIVQSEKIRDTYIRIFKAHYGNRFGKPEEKFVALGSPKYDKIISTKREDCELPEEWRSLIGDKKVVFYNTSIGAMLTGNEQYLRKLRHVLDLFRSRGDVALWWRPHPLNEAVYQSMRPHLLGEYMKIIANYKCEGFGIYDDTPDLHRAVAWSDAYYGDGSSIVSLFEACGKPVIIQVVDIEENLSNAFLNFSSLMAHDDCLYLTDNRINNVIWKLSLDDLKLKYFLGLPDYPFNKFLQFRNTKFHEGKFYVFPFYGDSVIVYDTEAETVDEIHIPVDEALKNESHGGLAHLCNLFYKGKLFLFPFCYKAIISIDIKTKEVLIHTKWIEEMQKSFFNVDNRFFGSYTVLDGTKVLLPSLSSNCILEYNLETGESKAHRVGNSDISFSGISKYNGTIWLTCYNRPLILKWDIANNSVVELEIAYPGFCSYGEPFLANVVQYENFIFLFPKKSNMAFKINMETNEIKKVDVLEPYCTSEPERKEISVFNGVIIHNDWIFANSDNTQKVFMYNITTDELTVIDKNDLRRTITESDFMKVISTVIKSFDTKCGTNDNPGIDGAAGQAIFNFAKNIVSG